MEYTKIGDKMVENKFLIVIILIVIPAFLIYFCVCFYKLLKKLKKLKKSMESDKKNLKIYSEYQRHKYSVIAYVILMPIVFILLIYGFLDNSKRLTGIYDNNYMIQKCEITEVDEGRSRADKISCKNENFYTKYTVVEYGDLDYEDERKYACIKYYPNVEVAEVLRIDNKDNLSCEEFYWPKENDKSTNLNYSVLKCDVNAINSNIIDCSIESSTKISNIKIENEKNIKEKDGICLKYYWSDNTGKILEVNQSNENFSCDKYIKQEETKDNKN